MASNKVKLYGFPEFITPDGHEDDVCMERWIDLPFLPEKGLRLRWPDHGVTDENEPITFEFISTYYVMTGGVFHSHVACWAREKFKDRATAIKTWEALGFKLGNRDYWM